MARKYRTHNFNCKQCGVECVRVTQGIVPPNFCGQSCRNKWQFEHGRKSSFSREEQIKRLGLEKVLLKEQERLAKNTFVFNCELCGKLTTTQTRNPLPRFCSKKCSGKINSTKNRQKPSEKSKQQWIDRLIKQPEKFFTWSSIKGWYKGVFFASSYEYFFLKWLEEQKVSILDKEVQRDVFRISYDYENKSHIYLPDFYVQKLNTVFEVKNSFALKNDQKIKIKAVAAKDFFDFKNINYKIVTENDFFVPKQKDIISIIDNDSCAFIFEKKTQENDFFDKMFEEQFQFMQLLQKERSFPDFPVSLASKEGQKLVKDISHDCMHELFEAVQLLKNSKDHRKTDVGAEFNMQDFLEEISDVWHYLIEICILTGISSNDLYKAFMKKSTINFARILNNY
jgi:hypothetical protein